jgi:predicted transcriptional regulator
MTVVSSKEFASNQKKYYDLAVNGQVCIRRGRNMFHLTYGSVADDDDGSSELLSPAKSRMKNGEYTGGEEYMNFLNKLINKPKPETKLSEILLSISREGAESLGEHIKRSREEWDI